MAKDYQGKEFCLRLFTTGMCFLVLFSMQSMRLNMSVAIVCMVNHTALSEIRFTNHMTENITFNDYEVSSGRNAITRVENTGRSSINKTQHLQPDCMEDQEDRTEEKREYGPFLWTKSQRGWILNAYFWGYVAFTIPCGCLANRFNCVRMVTIFTALSSVLCLLIPLVASHSYLGVVVLRALTGSLAGLFTPAVQNLLAKWLPPSQLASIGSLAFTGATCGTIVTFIASGYMCKYGFAGGWRSIFYINGSFCLVVTLIWFLLVREYPKTSSSNMKQMTCVVKRSDVGIKSQKVPWKRILTSKPVFAVIMCTAAIDSYGTVTTLYLPTYFADVMNFKIVSNGMLSALPYIFKSLVQFLGGVLSDFLKRKTSLEVGTLRKIIVATGKFICAVSIIAIGFLTCELVTLAVVLMVTSLAATGFMELGVTINLIDIAGPYAGLVLSISCFISNIVGLAAASVTSAINSESSSRESWQIVFAMCALIVFSSLVVYVCLASGKTQPWAVFHDSQNEVDVPLHEQSAPVDAIHQEHNEKQRQLEDC